MVLISLILVFLLIPVVLDGSFVFKVFVVDVLVLAGFRVAVLGDSAVMLMELVIVASVISAGAVFLDSVIVAAVDGVTVADSAVVVIGFAVLVLGLDGLVVVEFVAFNGVGVAVN